jgi:hypothetical protein
VSQTNPFTVIYLFRILQPCLAPMNIAAAFGKPVVSTLDFFFHYVTVVFRHVLRGQDRSYNRENHRTIQEHPEASRLYQ